LIRGNELVKIFYYFCVTGVVGLATRIAINISLRIYEDFLKNGIFSIRHLPTEDGFPIWRIAAVGGWPFPL
jgi:hypothetical protein